MKRYAIYGGAFNPPTHGHFHVIQSVLLSGKVDELWVMPSYIHFHGKDMAPFEDRVAMCEMMVARIEKNVKVMGYEKYIHDNYEYNGSTIQFMEHLRKIVEPDSDFTLVIGQDNADSMQTWNRGIELTTREKFFVLPRNVSPDVTHEAWYTKEPHYFMNYFTLENVSSTMVRDEIKNCCSKNGYNNATINNMVCHDVLEHIVANKLYRG